MNRQARKLLDFDQPSISLINVQLNSQLCGEICDALADNETVTSLDFSRNVIGDDGCDHVARLIAVNKTIVSLNLAHNSIADAGAIVIARAARRHGTLQSLNLSGNPINEAGLTEIARFVQNSTQLTELVLLDTQMSIRAALTLAEAMIVNVSLLYVSLPYTLGFTVLDEVQRILVRNFGRRHHVDEQLGMAKIAAGILEERRQQQARQWALVQHNAEPPTSRIATVAAPLLDWTDASQRTSLVYLSLLDKKSKIVNRQEQQALATINSPRGRGAYNTQVDVDRVVVTNRPFQGMKSGSGSGSLSARSDVRMVSLPPLPNHGAEGFTASFQGNAKRRR